MKSKVLMILAAVAALHLVVIGTITMTGGCKTNEVLQERPGVPVPSNAEPSDSPAAPPSGVELKKPEPVLTPQDTFTPPPAAPKAELLTHKVEKGDSLWKIARKYGVSTGELAAENNMSPDKALRVGVVLRIPPGGSLRADVPEKASAPKSAKPEHKDAPKKPSSSHPAKKSDSPAAKAQLPVEGTYVVKSGDSLDKIAKRHGLKIDEIVKANNLDAKKPLQIGQKLSLKAGARPVEPAGGAAASKTAPKADAGKVAAADPSKIEAMGQEDIDKILDAPAEPVGGAATAKASASAPGTAAPTPVAKTNPPVASEQTAGAAAKTAAPAAEGAAPATNAEFYMHEVIEGETSLDEIAALYGVKADDIRKLNPDIPADGKLKPSSSLKIPKK